jgi:hypothetical protein
MCTNKKDVPRLQPRETSHGKSDPTAKLDLQPRELQRTAFLTRWVNFRVLAQDGLLSTFVDLGSRP